MQREKTEALAKNRRLQAQLAEKTSEVENLTEQVQQLRNEKVETQHQNQKLQNENAGLVRQNRNLRNENETLRNLDKAKPQNSNEMLGPELPKKIQDYRNIVTRAGVYNNHGVIAFNRKDYDKAIGHFKTSIKADSKFAIAHYNLGVYLLRSARIFQGNKCF